MVQYTYHAKISNFVENFMSGMVRLRSIWILGHFRVSLFCMLGQVRLQVNQFGFRVTCQFCQI